MTGKDLGGRLENGGSTGSQWDSIVQASFQLAGAFSEKKTTAEGVEAINATPVLHMSIGPNQADALVDEIGYQSLGSFHRERDDTTMIPKKRPLSQTFDTSIKLFHKKPTLRASKQQKMVDVLAGLVAKG